VLVVKDSGDAGTADVSATGPRYILRIAVPGEGVLAFSNYGVPLHVIAPTSTVPLPSS
jgi:hypothetical protein